MAFGKRIKFFRNRKGMKQKELGELLGFLGKNFRCTCGTVRDRSKNP